MEPTLTAKNAVKVGHPIHTCHPPGAASRLQRVYAGQGRGEGEVHAPEPGEGWAGGGAGVAVVQYSGLLGGGERIGGGGSGMDVSS